MILDKFSPERESLLVPDPDGDYVRLRDVGELRDENCKLLAQMEKAKSLLREVMSWHADKNSRDYNDCDQTKCLWCEEAQALLDSK